MFNVCSNSIWYGKLGHNLIKRCTQSMKVQLPSRYERLLAEFSLAAYAYTLEGSGCERDKPPMTPTQSPVEARNE